MKPRAALFTALLVLAHASNIAAETSLGLDPGAVRTAEGQVEIPVVLKPAQDADVAALQFDLRFDETTWRYAGAEPGQSATVAGKSVHGNRRQPGALRVIVAGFNQNTMTTGTVARLAFTPVPGTAQPLNAALTDPILSDPFGNPLPIQLATPALRYDPERAVAVATEAAPREGDGASLAALARYRALIFAAVLVAGMMFVSRRIPRKGRLR